VVEELDLVLRAAEVCGVERSEVEDLVAEARREVSGVGFLDACEHVAMLWSVVDGRWGCFAKVLLLERIYAEAGREFRGLRDFEARASYQALRLMYARYLLRGRDGRVVEAPNDALRRVAEFVAIAEARYGGEPRVWASRFYELMSRARFFPNSPTIMNAATRRPQLAACFVIPMEDDMASIMDAARVTALVLKTGAGVGIDFSRLRPRGDYIAGTGGRSSGPLSFAKLIDAVADVVKEGGKRRGALMGIVHDWHQDVESFIEAKCRDPRALQNYNISIGIHDRFMEAALSGGEWRLYNPRLCEAVRDPLSEDLDRARESCTPSRVVSAAELFEKIVECAWRCGDPGAVFIDTINRHNPTPSLGRIHATNPCGETPLLDWEACNLGSINLAAYVRRGRIAWDELARDVECCIRFLDNVIDMSWYPDPRIEEAVLRTRKVGLGVMGLADALIELGIPYDSHDALYVADAVAEFIAFHARKASNELARERGPYPEFHHSIHARGRFNWEPQTPASSIYDIDRVSERARSIVADRPSLDWEQLRREMMKGTRNATVTTIAPTGSISILAGVSSSIEPLFSLVYIRETAIGRFVEVPPKLATLLRASGRLSRETLLAIARGDKSALGSAASLFRTAHEIDPEWHVRMQAVFQRWVDNAVSKTVNMSFTATKDDVKRVLVLAWKLGCKGVTVFRDRSRPEQVLVAGKELEDVLRSIPERVEERGRMIHRWFRIGKLEIMTVGESYSGGCPYCDY